jgi:hypothetical protein
MAYLNVHTLGGCPCAYVSLIPIRIRKRLIRAAIIMRVLTEIIRLTYR